jgi:hypothetical protein
VLILTTSSGEDVPTIERSVTKKSSLKTLDSSLFRYIFLSQNRQSAKDRLMAESDYHRNVKGEEEIRHIMEHSDHQDTIILRILQQGDVRTPRAA